MKDTEAWLAGVLRAGGDTEHPLSPNIPASYLPRSCKHKRSRRENATSASPEKRKRSPLSEIDPPNGKGQNSKETCLSLTSPKRQCVPRADIKASSMPPPKRRVPASTEDVDEGTANMQPDATVRQTRRDTRMTVRSLGESFIPARGGSRHSETSKGIPDDQHRQEASIGESADSKNSKRSLSPTKRMVDLRVAEKKIAEMGITESSDVPDDVQNLYLGVQTTAMAGCGIVPREIKDEVGDVCKGVEPFLDFMVASQAARMTEEQLLRELEELVKIRNGTLFCNKKKVHEPSWNERVHSRMLQQAVQFLPGVEYHNITTARVLRELVPDNIYGETLKKKMLDYAITLGDPVIAESDVIARLGSSVGVLRRTINPSDYSPLCYDPVAISIETKTPEGSEQEAKVQLSVWIIAQFNRLRQLLPATVAGQPISVTLPLLFASGDSWTLLFASDQDDCINIIGGILIGSTASILGCYKVLSAIRCLCEWATTTFKDWFTDNVLTPE